MSKKRKGHWRGRKKPLHFARIGSAEGWDATMAVFKNVFSEGRGMANADKASLTAGFSLPAVEPIGEKKNPTHPLLGYASAWMIIVDALASSGMSFDVRGVVANQIITALAKASPELVVSDYAAQITRKTEAGSIRHESATGDREKDLFSAVLGEEVKPRQGNLTLQAESLGDESPSGVLIDGETGQVKLFGPDDQDKDEFWLKLEREMDQANGGAVFRLARRSMLAEDVLEAARSVYDSVVRNMIARRDAVVMAWPRRPVN